MADTARLGLVMPDSDCFVYALLWLLFAHGAYRTYRYLGRYNM